VSNASLKRFLAQYKTMINKLIESIKLERLTPSIQVQQDHHHHTVLAKNARKDQRLTVLTESVDLYASCENRLLGIKWDYSNVIVISNDRRRNYDLYPTNTTEGWLCS